MKDDGKQISRRAALKAGMTVLAGSLVATEAFAQDPDAGKMSQSVVQYRHKWAANGNHCAVCLNYIDPGACKLVAGKIDPNGVCLAFAKKKAG
jgi:hypothetical protein